MIELCTRPERKKPNSNWSLIAITTDYTAWQMGQWCALSSVALLNEEHLPAHWEWLISFSRLGKARLSDKEIRQCLKDFDALDFEEDNHEPGISRKFWLAVDHKYRKPCPCKDEVIVAEDEYLYSKKKSDV